MGVIGGGGVADLVIDSNDNNPQILDDLGSSFVEPSTNDPLFGQNSPPTSDVLSSSTATNLNNNLNFNLNVNLNLTNLDDFVRIGTDPSFMTFLFSLLCGFLWVLYITFYSSRIIGLVVTKVANRFIKGGYVKIGSISVSVLSGKIMFRDAAYVTEDCSLRIQDGWIVFRWWRAYVPKDISEGNEMTKFI